MSPLGLLVPASAPRWVVDCYFPLDRFAVGVNIEPDHVGGAPYTSAVSQLPSLDSAGLTSVGASATYQQHETRLCCRMRTAGGAQELLRGQQFPWWTPHWGPASEIAAGYEGDRWNRVAIFDVWLSFSDAASRYVDDTSGVLFMAGDFDVQSVPANRPTGLSPRTSFGLMAFNDGGTQGIHYRAYDAAGAPLETVNPSVPISPTDWNHGLVQITAASDGREAQLDVFLNGEELVNGREFGSAQLLRPEDFGAGVAPTFHQVFSCSRDSGTPDMFYLWRSRFGTFRADGVEVRK